MAEQKIRLSNHGLVDYKINQDINEDGTPAQQVIFKYRTVSGGRAPKPRFRRPKAPGSFPTTERLLARLDNANEQDKI